MSEERPEITEAWVLAQLGAIVGMDGAKPAEQLKALELLGRHLGMFAGGGGPEQRMQPVIIYGMPEGEDDREVRDD